MTASSNIIWLAHFILICNTFGFAAKLLGEIKRIEAMLGGKVMMPCDVTPSNTNDTLLLLVWYKGNKPFYSYDGRLTKHWRSGDFFQNDRIIFSFHTEPASLLMDRVNLDDEGTYRCRADFSLSPTRNIGIYLFVIIVPSKPFFMDEIGNKVEYKVGPFHEGDMLVLICLAVGGKPIPKLTWWKSNILLDSSDEPSEVPGVRENQLMLTLTREFAGAHIQCLASNNNVTVPLSSSLEIELYVSPESVTILSSKQALTVGKMYELPCYVNGSNPLPEVSWWLDGKLIIDQQIIEERMQNNIMSTLHFKPSIEHNEKDLTCLATNKVMPPKLATKCYTFKLNIFFPPIITLSLVMETQIKPYVNEGDNIQLRCMVDANPWITNTEWFGNNNTIKGSLFNGSQIMLTSNDLLILNVRKQHTGNYSCMAFNLEGSGRSNVLSLYVSYKPRCIWFNIIEFDNVTQINCPVSAYPNTRKFYWKIMNNNTTNKTFTSNESRIHLDLIVNHTKYLYSTDVNILCWSENEIGEQDEPCSIVLKQLSKVPDAPENCKIEAIRDSIKIKCKRTVKNSLDRLICASVWQRVNNTKILINNITSPISRINIDNLNEGQTYDITLFAFNRWGKSEIVNFTKISLDNFQLFSTTDVNYGMLSGVIVAIILIVLLLIIILVYKKRKKIHSSREANSDCSMKNGKERQTQNKAVNADISEKPLLHKCNVILSNSRNTTNKTEPKSAESVDLIQVNNEENGAPPPEIHRNNKPKLSSQNTFNSYINLHECAKSNFNNAKCSNDMKISNGLVTFQESRSDLDTNTNLKLLNMSKESIV